MAKAVFLLFSLLVSLFFLSHARNQITLPEHSNRETVPGEHISQEEPKLLLPSENPEKIVIGNYVDDPIEEFPITEIPEETNTVSSESDANPIAEEKSRPDSDTISAFTASQPLKHFDVDFRPVVHLHHMRVRRPFWFRFPRRCHGHHHHHKHDGFRREIPYGNGMIQFPVDRYAQFPARNVEVETDLTQIPMRPRMRDDFDGVRQELPMEARKFNGRFGNMEERTEEEEKQDVSQQVAMRPQYGNGMIQFPVGSYAQLPVRKVEVEADLTQIPMRPRMRDDLDGVRQELPMEAKKFNGRFGNMEEQTEEEDKQDVSRREIPYGNDMIQFPVGRDAQFPLRNVEVEGDLTQIPMRPGAIGEFDGARREFPVEAEKFNGRFGYEEEREEEEEEKGGFLRWIKKLID